MSGRLSGLLSPVSLDDFFESYRNREYLYIDRNITGFYDGVVRVEDLDLFLESEMLPAPLMNVVANGVRGPLEDWSRTRTLPRGHQVACAPERLLRLYREGSTLILNCADETVPPLSLTCRELARELGHPVHANIYITPPDAQGFVRHSDDHDVFILQVSGQKSWLIYPSEDAGTPFELEMRDGDLLYIPRGMSHEARCSVHRSIHVTVGLYPTYAFQLVEELAAAARENPLFQQPVPGAIGAREAREDFDLEFVRRLQVLFSETPPANLIERRFRHFVDTQQKGWPGRLSDVLRLSEITGATVLRARSFITVRIEDCGAFIAVHFAGNRITVPKFLHVCLNQLLAGTAFAVQDLQGMLTAQGKVDFVRPFVATGLVSIVKI